MVILVATLLVLSTKHVIWLFRAQVYAALAADGVKRCTEIPFFKLLLLSLYAGFYVSFGGLVSTSVVALLPGKLGAPVLLEPVLPAQGCHARMSS